ncbi:hypothetical protein L6164_000575 [Bauhinia variegata]|nr:hypothetical protein L6164_000575 [Bauhinia variegata]
MVELMSFGGAAAPISEHPSIAAPPLASTASLLPRSDDVRPSTAPSPDEVLSAPAPSAPFPDEVLSAPAPSPYIDNVDSSAPAHSPF